MTTERQSESGFLVVAVLTFVASTAATIAGCYSMTMPGMEMPGGWTMSMTWMRMPGQTWSDAAAMFLGMWTVMMVAMMLPALTPALSRYRRAVQPEVGARLDRLTATVATAYFTVWSITGLAVFALGVALAELAMELSAVSRAVPVITAITLIAAGVLQFSKWKSRELECCRRVSVRTDNVTRTPDHSRAAWQHGLRLGIHCVRCCAGLTAMLLVLGMMDLRVMAVVTLAITAERVAPGGQRVARLIGAIAIATGLILLSQT